MPTVSFEFFPPKTPEMEARLWDAVTALAPLSPSFVSVTYGAGGSTRVRTHATVGRILRETKLIPAAHLTCVNASREEVDGVARSYWETGVRHIVALRGDPPQGMETYVPHPQGYAHASELVAGLKKVAPFEISVAAFPERHPEAKSVEEGIGYLKQKVDAGASRAITQYFFEVDHYARFIEKARKAGISVPIVPGILPIGNFTQLQKFSAMCGATIPDWLTRRFEKLDAASQPAAAIEIATEQCRKLLALGASHLHFYTLNRADLTGAICKALGIGK